MNVLLSLLSDYTFLMVAAGTALLGGLCGILGSFAVLRRESLIGDAVSHASMPGIVLAWLFTGSKTTGILLAGAMLSGLVCLLLIRLIVRTSRLPFDCALALFLSVFFGGGMVLLTYAKRLPDAGHAGLDRYLYGQAGTLLAKDVAVCAAGGLLILLITFLFFKEFLLITFDADYARSAGLPVRALTLLLSLLLILLIVLGLQSVGAVFMSALLTAPAAAARQWTRSLKSMCFLAALFGALSGVAATVSSCLVPDLPSGPAVICCVFGIAAFSLLFAPGRGILFCMIRRLLSGTERSLRHD